MNPNDYNALDERKRQMLLEAMEQIRDAQDAINRDNEPPAESYYDEQEGKWRPTNAPLEITLTASVSRGYVRDLKSGTIYKLETWLERVERGLAAWEHAEKGKG